MNSVFQFLVILILNLLGSGSTEAAPKPMPTDSELRRDIRFYEHKNPNLALEIPVHAEYYSWRIKGKIGGVDLYPTEVPVVVYEEDRMRTRQISVIAVGQEFEIKKVQNIKGAHYYSYELPQTVEGVREGWIAGYFIEKVE